MKIEVYRPGGVVMKVKVLPSVAYAVRQNAPKEAEGEIGKENGRNEGCREKRVDGVGEEG